MTLSKNDSAPEGALSWRALAALEPRPIEDAELAAALPSGAYALQAGDGAYPEVLSDLGESAPRLLACLGSLSALSRERFVSIVGSRDADSERQAAARRMAETVARLGYVVVSGLAAGVDRAAHMGALDAGGRTIAVLGTPLSRPYPNENVELAHDIVRSGGLLLSEVPQAAGQAFSDEARTAALKRRNRIVAALGTGSVVMAAKTGTSTLIEARAALSIGRPVLIWHEAARDARLRGESWVEALLEEGESAACRTPDGAPLALIVESAQAVMTALSPWQNVWWL